MKKQRLVAMELNKKKSISQKRQYQWASLHAAQRSPKALNSIMKLRTPKNASTKFLEPKAPLNISKKLKRITWGRASLGISRLQSEINPEPVEDVFSPARKAEESEVRHALEIQIRELRDGPPYAPSPTLQADSASSRYEPSVNTPDRARLEQFKMEPVFTP